MVLLCLPQSLLAQNELPTANPSMTVETEEGETEETDYNGSAPIVAHFTSNVENLGSCTALYEWIVYEEGKENNPYLRRYDKVFDYTFTKTIPSRIKLQVSFISGTDTIAEYVQETPFKITASSSSLIVPNAFSPNGDDSNDVFRVKPGYKSIVEFHGYIFNRWGRKLFEWKDISQGWDGRYNGTDVPDGVYYCRIDAKGADGKIYRIRKAVNLLRGYNLEGSQTGGGN